MTTIFYIHYRWNNPYSLVRAVLNFMTCFPCCIPGRMDRETLKLFLHLYRFPRCSLHSRRLICLTMHNSGPKKWGSSARSVHLDKRRDKGWWNAFQVAAEFRYPGK
jgi:hypothetical protein